MTERTTLQARLSGGRLRRAGAVAVLASAFVALGATTAVPGPLDTAAAEAAPLATTCEPFGAIDQGTYWINNNLWGQDSGTGTQCVEDVYTDGDTIGWRTNWEWSGGPNQVKSFASTVLGWHWGWRHDDTGLPVRLSAGDPVPSTWRYSVEPANPGTMNVAYDLWLHDVANPTWENDPTDEVMIWLYTTGGAGPVGERVDTVTIEGAQWDLYVGDIGWNVYSFVRTSNTESVDLDLSAFTGHLVDRGEVDPAKYLSSVQAGTEVFTGQGTLETTAYRTTVG